MALGSAPAGVIGAGDGVAGGTVLGRTCMAVVMGVEAGAPDTPGRTCRGAVWRALCPRGDVAEGTTPVAGDVECDPFAPTCLLDAVLLDAVLLDAVLLDAVLL